MTCTCGHNIVLHSDAGDKLCSSCNCWQYTETQQQASSKPSNNNTSTCTQPQAQPQSQPQAQPQSQSQPIKSSQSQEAQGQQLKNDLDTPTGTQSEPQTGQNAAKTNDDNQQEALPENVRDNLRKLRIVIDQLHSHFTQARELILDTARRLDEEHVVKQDEICRKIKELLKDKIQETKISEGWIEECLPTEYKRKYEAKPKSQLNHLSKFRPEQQIAVTQMGKSETVKDTVIDNICTMPPYRGQQNIDSTQTADSKLEQDIEKPTTPITPVSTPVKHESAAAKTQPPQPQPQESQVEPKPEQVLQETSHKITILLPWDTLSEQMAQAHSPGIEWVRLSGVLDEKSRIMSNLRLERFDVEGKQQSMQLGDMQ